MNENGGIAEPVASFATTALPTNTIAAQSNDIDFMGELLPDGPTDDRTDHALKARADGYQQANDLELMLNSVELPPQEGGSAVGTVVEGFGEIPRQALGGVRDAAQSTLEFLEYLGANAEALAPIGGLQIFEDGEFSPAYIPPSELAAGRKAGTVTSPDLPDVGKPRTALGSGVRSITQFVRPYHGR